VNVCPTGALSFKDVVEGENAMRVLKIEWDICIECGQCQMNCLTEEGIKLSQEFDISTTENRKDLSQTIRKDLVLCEHCNKPIACKDHIYWTIKKLGPLYVTNTTLISFHKKELLINDIFYKKKEKFLRSDRFCLLCPLCRREAVAVS
jgi:hydrogenase-4 component H